MIIECVVGGSFLTNCYIIADEDSKEGIIVDPGSQVHEVLDRIEELGLKVDKIVNTHAHIDHASGVQEAKDTLGAKFYLHPKEKPVLDLLPESALRFPEFSGVEVPEIDEYLEEGDVVEIGKYKADVLLVPGHTWGSICLVIDEHIFSGDTLFAGSVGRVDLTGGTSMQELVGSINKKLLVYPPESKVYPGHGPVTTIDIEKRSNPFLGGGTLLF
ncbi:MAG: MBL fold metallo-hydrolase [Candidatus Dadabacteria bacterium]|nr:MBL fold metallo-hydrolase [Candidatus Dadabacteria bacterium]NIS07307.1 MBL fold metallo-hydrolase [Candidatus Dadabacteria bacterium]NIY20945.1 MBL fold metallo-hydrolase [Candidatus Dadabacteria bacterium]